MNRDPAAIEQTGVRFGRCELRAQQRELKVAGKPVAIGSRAFDLLLLLIAAAGELVSKDRILKEVWPGMIVEENTIQVHISMLRKALGSDREALKTISGRGYRFVARLAPCGAPGADGTEVTARVVPTNLPAPTSELIGREADLARVIDLLMSHRLVTLVGAGGLGKTRIGLDVARRLRDRFPDGVWLAGLGSLRAPGLVAPTVAAALGLESADGSGFAERIGNGLAGKVALVVLDDCEHVIDAASQIAETLLLASSTVRVIATSREPLRADGERIFHVPGLGMARQYSDDLDEMLASGAVQLFMARAQAAEPRLGIDRRTASAAAAICRRLDGIPLAIELAAARVAALGVEEVAARLDDRFALLNAGRRTALPRHQTLRATMDWSYDLLSAPERMTLRRLSVFAGAVTFAAASAVIADGDFSVGDAMTHIATLVEKSLVVADVDGSVTRYRLLETTLQYAREKLAESGEREPLARRHALYFLDLLEGAEAEADTRAVAEWLAQYGPCLDDVRAALGWSFAPGGDASLAVALTVAATPLWFQCSLAEECRERVDRALSRDVPDASRDLRSEMRLLAARSESLGLTNGLGLETCVSWTRTLDLAASLDNAEYQLRALSELVEIHANMGDLAQASALGRRLHDIAARRGDAGDLLAGERMVGHVLHLMGDHAAARLHLESQLERVKLVVQSHLDRYRVDQGVAARCVLARILWLEGLAEQARTVAELAAQQARAIGHADSLRHALAHGSCTLSLLAEDFDAAERNVALLRQSCHRTTPGYWHALCRGFEGQGLIARGQRQGLALLRGALEELGERGFEGFCRPFVGAASLGLAAAGRLHEALTSIEAAIAYAERSAERWSLPEWLRINAELLLLDDPSNRGAAELLLLQGLDCARRQGAVAWEQRCARSLARLQDSDGRASRNGPLAASREMTDPSDAMRQLARA
ncbi:MAG TPA: winged helix-turn-helix domain-containing protein [Steroidobacteraceae bacterium]|nr:winged helix-turn-helix domain-containing protein [Steroidobacteraceae bacterium]